MSQDTKEQANMNEPTEQTAKPAALARPKPLTPTQVKYQHTYRLKDIRKLVPRHLLHVAAELTMKKDDHFRRFGIENVAVHPDKIFSTDGKMACMIPLPKPLPVKPEHKQPLLLDGEDLRKSKNKPEAKLTVKEAAGFPSVDIIIPPEQEQPTMSFNLDRLLTILKGMKALGAEHVRFTASRAEDCKMSNQDECRRLKVWRFDGYGVSKESKDFEQVMTAALVPIQVT